MGPTLTFRSRLARVLAVAAAVVGAATLVAFAVTGGWRELLRSGPVVALVVALAWALFWRPRVEVSDGGVVMVDVLRTVHVPWPAFRGADSRWALTVRTEARTFTSWAVPAGSGSGARMPRGRRGEAGRPSPQGREGPDDDTPTDRRLVSSGTAEAAALAISDRLEALRSQGHLDRPREVPVEVHVETSVIAVVAVLAVAATVGLTLG